MQYFATDRGVARRAGSMLHLLDVEPTALTTALRGGGSLDDLADVASVGTIALADAQCSAPLTPERVIIVGLNYRSHADEVSVAVPDELIFAAAEPGHAVIGPRATIQLPASHPDHVDYEGEIVVIIGRDATDLEAADAWSVISGITAGNDMSARDLQRDGFATGDHTTAKMLPTFKPLGPGVISPAEAQGGLVVRCSVNGEERQSATDQDMVCSIEEIVSVISKRLGLRAGDVIYTGSPPGVGFVTGRFLRAGDEVEVTVGQLPPLRNTVVAEP